MKVLLVLLAVASVAQGSAASACSYAIREHPTLASRSPRLASESGTTVRIAIAEALLPTRRAKTQYVLDRVWLGVRGHRMMEGKDIVSSDAIEITGRIDPVCFYPGDAYQVLPDGRLIVWITGQLRAGSPMKLLLPTASPQAYNDDGVWRSVRWSMNEVKAARTLPSPLQPGMIAP